MTRHGQRCIWVLIVFLSLKSVRCTEGSEQNDDDGFCTKSGDGIECTFLTDMGLTRLESQREGEIKEIKVDGKQLQLETVNLKPLVFEVKNFLSEEDCDHLIAAAKTEGLIDSATEKNSDTRDPRNFVLMDVNEDKQLSIEEMKLTLENAKDVYLDTEDVVKMYTDLALDVNEDSYITPDELKNVKPNILSQYIKEFLEEHPEKHSRYSKQAWLFPDQSRDEVFENIQRRVATVVQLPLDLVRLSDFQIVDYDVNGHYNAHWDSGKINPEFPCCDRGRIKRCRTCRYMTILFYLNDVEGGGETAFPVANNETLDITKATLYKVGNLYQRCDEAKLLVSPEKGKAVIWYNHFVDAETGWMGDLDEYTLHGGCPVTEGEKWIANFWIRTSESKSADIERMEKFHSSG